MSREATEGLEGGRFDGLSDRVGRFGGLSDRGGRFDWRFDGLSDRVGRFDGLNVGLGGRGGRFGGLSDRGQWAGASTTGVPWVWKVSMVFMPHACPFLRSASLHSTTG